tara:strand:+ start:2638 stop:3873 length:1236 start_codon:yes stop_codon:yes gene_type:complete
MNLNLSSRNIKNSLSEKVQGIFSGVGKTIKKTNKIKRNTRALILKNYRKRLRRKKFEAEERRLENAKKLNKKSSSISTKNIGSNLIKAVSLLFAGWLIKNLPKIIESIKDVIKKINNFVDGTKKFVDFLSQNMTEIVSKLIIFSKSLSDINFKQSSSKLTRSMQKLSGEFKNIKTLTDGKQKLLKSKYNSFKQNPNPKGKNNLKGKNRSKSKPKNVRGGGTKLSNKLFKAPQIPKPKKVPFNLTQRLKNMFTLKNVKSFAKGSLKSGVYFGIDYTLNLGADYVMDQTVGKAVDSSIKNKVDQRIASEGRENVIKDLENQLALEVKKKPLPWWKNVLSLGYGEIFTGPNKRTMDVLNRKLDIAKDKDIIIINNSSNNNGNSSTINNKSSSTVIIGEKKGTKIEDWQHIKLGE